MELTVLPALRVLLDPEFSGIAQHFVEQMMRGKGPLCLCCSHEFSSPQCVPPSGFALVTTAKMFRAEQSRAALASPLCSSCFAATDLAAKCVGAYRAMIWPQLHVANVHPAPGEVM